MESSENPLHLCRLHGVTFRYTTTLLLSFVIQPGSCSDMFFFLNQIYATCCLLCPVLCVVYELNGRSQWPRGLRRRSATAHLVRTWVRIPPGTWMSVCCECCVLSGRGLCDELITRPEESYRLLCVVVCDLEPSRLRRTYPALGRSAKKKIKM